MKNIIACSTHSYHGYPFERALEGIAASGLKYVEIAAIPGHSEHVSPEKMNTEEMERLKEKLDNYGLTAVSISGHCNLADKEGLCLFKKRMDLARVLGITYVNTADGETGTEEGKQEFYNNIREAADYDRNIMICLETHGGLLGDGKTCRRTLEIINRDNVKINYDPANLMFFEGKMPEFDIVSSVSDIGHFHIKDKLGGKGEWNFPTIGRGYLNFAILFEKLKQSDYQGPLSFELEFTDEGPKSPKEVDESLKESIAYVREISRSIGW